jgi:membrane protein implicated in regulation of membrane protease activity
MTRAGGISQLSRALFPSLNREHRPVTRILIEGDADKLRISLRNSYDSRYFLGVFVAVIGSSAISYLLFYGENWLQFLFYSLVLLLPVVSEARRVITFQPPAPLVSMDRSTVVTRARGILRWRKRALPLPEGAATAVVEIPMRTYRGVPVGSSEYGVRLKVGEEVLSLVDGLSHPEAIRVRDTFAAALRRLRPDFAVTAGSGSAAGASLQDSYAQPPREAETLGADILTVRSGWNFRGVFKAAFYVFVTALIVGSAFEVSGAYGYIANIAVFFVVISLVSFLLYREIGENIRKDVLVFDEGRVEIRTRGVLGRGVKTFEARGMDELRVEMDQGEYAWPGEGHLPSVFHVAFDHAEEAFQIGSRLSLQRAVQLRDDIAAKLIRARSEA